jgi:hypothetical protein
VALGPPPPTPLEITAAREALGLSYSEAALIIYHRPRGWRYLESGERTMHPALWKLWRFASDPPPELREQWNQWCIQNGYEPS